MIPICFMTKWDMNHYFDRKQNIIYALHLLNVLVHIHHLSNIYLYIMKSLC